MRAKPKRPPKSPKPSPVDARGLALEADLLQTFTPDVAALLGGRAADEWLLDEARRLSGQPDVISRCAVAGLIGRLWTPRDDVDAELLLLRAGKGPGPNARAWYAARPPASRRELEVRLRIGIEGLLTTLPGPDSLRARRPKELALSVRDWVLRRDDLESVAFLLEGREQAALRRHLEAVDDLATAELSFLGEQRLFEVPRLRAVSWQEPERWWGQLAAG